MGSTDNAAASTAAKVSSNAGTGFGNSSGGEFDTSPTPSSGLSGSVGIGGANAPSDIFQVSSALASNGLMDAPQNTADSTLYSGIISAQESMGSDLKPDGLVNPDGPTQQEFTKLSNQGFVKAPAPATPPTSLPEKPVGLTKAPGTTPVMPVDEANSVDNAKLLERQNAKARQQAKQDVAVERIHNENRDKQARTQARQTAKLQQDQAEQNAKQQRKAVNAVKKLTKTVYERLNPASNIPSPSTPRHPLPKGEATLEGTNSGIPPLPMGEGRSEGSGTSTPLSDETIQSNQRLADSLKKRAGVGDLPKFTSDAINTDGEKAIPEIVDLLHEVEDPAQARELYHKTLEGIAPEHQEQFENAYTLSLSGSTDNRDGSHQLSDDDAKEPADDDIWSIPDQPMADGGADHLPKRKIKEERVTESAKMDWNDKPLFQQSDGTKDLKIKGPIRIKAQSVTPGLDGIDYEVDWLPLGEDGNVVPVWRNNDHKIIKQEIGILMGQSEPSIH